MTRPRTSDRAEQDRRREEMRAAGMSYAEIAEDFGRRFRMRPRTAWRVACGWTLQNTADRINDLLRELGLDETGKASMTSGHLCEYEQWPGLAPPGGSRRAQGRKPTPLLLSILARLYDTTVISLLDYDDFRWMPEAERLFLGTAQVPEKTKHKDAERERGDGSSAGWPAPAGHPAVPGTPQPALPAAVSLRASRGGIPSMGSPDTLLDRRSVIAGGALVAGWLGLKDPERLTWAARHPAQVDMPVVRSLREMLAQQRHVEDAMGTVAVREPVLAQLATIENFVRQARGPVRSALLEVAAQWAQFSGYLHRDARDPAGDQMRLSQALEWAAEIGDRERIASVFVQRAYGALHSGEIGTVISLCQAAQQDTTIAVEERAYGAAIEAQGHAIAGDAAAAERKLGEVSEFAGKLPGQRQDRVPYLYWMTPQNLECHQGVALGWMADNPRYRERAVTALQTGYSALPDDQKSSAWATRNLVHLASVYARAGDLEQSCAVALQAAATAQRTGSVWLAEMLAQVLARLHSRWPGDPRVAEVAEAVR